MRLGVVILALACSATAGDLSAEVDKIVLELREQIRARRPKRLDEKTWAAWHKAFEKLRAPAAKKVEELAARHAPTGECDAKDIAVACRALLRPPLMPRGKAAWDLALRLLKLDPRNGECWSFLKLLVEHVEFEQSKSKPPWNKLRAWARAARTDAGIDGEAALALDLLAADLALRIGNKKAARREAQMVLDDGHGSAELKRHARRVRSLTTLLRAGAVAPGFRIKSIDGKRELRLKNYRGRAVLLFFSPVTEYDRKLEDIVEMSRNNLHSSELVILTIPPGDDADAIAVLREHATDSEWPIAEPGEVADQIALAYGAESICALFLIGPAGRVLMSGEWSLEESPKEIVRMVQESVGPPIALTLKALETGGTKESFRRFWHGLVERGRTVFEREIWAQAKGRGRQALILASAYASEAPDLDPGDDMVAAWWRLRHGKDEAGWQRWLKPALRPKSKECLELVDQIYDLGLFGDEVRAPIERVAVRSTRWETTSMALRCLQFQDTHDTPRVLKRHQKHKHWQVRLALAEALRAYRHKDAIDILIAMLGDKRTRVRTQAAKSLSSLTGELFGVTQKRWSLWRRAQGADIRFRPREITRKTPFRKKGHKYAHHGYYGLQVASNHLMFVLDKSDSMYYGLFDSVVEEMQAHLSSTGPTTKFNVIEFDEKPRAWKPKLVPANEANVRAAVDFLNRAKPYGPTNVIDSLRLARQTPQVDAIVLLSDGLPNRGNPSVPNAILAAVEKENRYDRIAIHAVLLLRGRSFKHDDPKGKDVPPIDEKEKARRKAWREHAPRDLLGRFLKELAESNDGTFGVGFADSWMPPPGAATRPSSDK